MTVHGGDVQPVAAELGIGESEILDFSANVNPRGLPQRARQRLMRDAADPQLLARYPDPSCGRLRKTLSEVLDVPVEAIVVGPGAEALLSPALRSAGPERALIPAPAFSEYRRVCEQQSVEPVPFLLERTECFRVPVDRLVRALEIGRFGALFLNNPHNPSGALLELPALSRILDAAQTAGTAVLLDEAFIDFAPHSTLAPEAATRRGVIVIRSLTKFFGCPALRAGYAVAHPETAARIAGFLPTWGVSQLASEALAAALEDHEYAQTSLRENEAARSGLRESLAALGITVFPPAANYLLCELRAGMPTSTELRMRLARNHRILIRNCDSYEGLEQGRYIRVAVRTGAENARLAAAIAEELKS